MAATLRLDIELLGANRVGLMVGELMMRAGGLAPVLDEIGAYGVDRVHQRFTDGKGPDGVEWEKSQRAIAEGGQTLIDHRRLEGSIQHEVGSTYVEIGTNLVYAGIHQFGGTITKYAASMPAYRKQSDVAAGRSRFVKQAKSDFMTYHEVEEHSIGMPARPYIGWTDEDATPLEGMVGDYLMGAFR